MGQQTQAVAAGRGRERCQRHRQCRNYRRHGWHRGLSQNPFGANGGDGGIGLAVTSASTIDNNSTITGGNGGAGGNNVGCCTTSTFTVFGGNGGNGDAGVIGTSAAIVNNGTIAGGNGGIVGTGGSGSGFAGAGGVGVVGSDLTIVNAGTISGGFANNGAGAQNYAIQLTGGTNSVGYGGTIKGGIDVAGRLFHASRNGIFCRRAADDQWCAHLRIGYDL